MRSLGLRLEAPSQGYSFPDRLKRVPEPSIIEGFRLVAGIMPKLETDPGTENFYLCENRADILRLQRQREERPNDFDLHWYHLVGSVDSDFSQQELV